MKLTELLAAFAINAVIGICGIGFVLMLAWLVQLLFWLYPWRGYD
ncbi:MAG TPA: hypothetical protein VK673_21945 [Chthoniobacterales bacterium]|nr:hypothetical protein [Chthoniobacterales bacterium]